ncbi:MAG: methionine adenosyltransferase [Chlorobiaceae bacterium]
MPEARNITIEEAASGRRMTELIERKGKGHPDTICDSVMESVCVTLCQEYMARAGRILHHNLDKGLLVAGKTIVRPGGGRVVEPMKIIFGDRATDSFKGVRIPIGEIAEAAAKEWFRENLRFVDPETHISFQNEIRQGSAELADLFSRSIIGANDTSVGAGYAPLSDAESLVIDTELYLNSPRFKQAFPETGEDIKIMACRHLESVTLTIAVAFVDRYIHSINGYFERKAALKEAIKRFVEKRGHPFEEVQIELNTLDNPTRGEAGVYLTVLGTSAEGADGGEVGRGNRVNGLISFDRPMSLEAAAGKNPVSHVGKIYNLLAKEMAERIHREVSGIRELSVLLCSQIGKPIDLPLSASARVMPEEGVHIEELRKPVAMIIDDELAGIHRFTERVARGEFPVC